MTGKKKNLWICLPVPLVVALNWYLRSTYSTPVEASFFFFFFNLLFYNCLNCKSPARIMTFFDKFIWSIHLKNRSLLNYYRKNIDVHITHNITVFLLVLIKAADRPLINSNQFQDKWKLWTRLPNKEYLTSIWKRIENLAAASKFNDQFCEFSLWLTKPCVNYSKLSAKCMK